MTARSLILPRCCGKTGRSHEDARAEIRLQKGSYVTCGLAETEAMQASTDCGLIRQGDDLHAQHVAELETAIAGLHEVLRDLAAAALKLADVSPPADPTDAAALADLLERARKVMEYMEPPRQ